VASPRTPPQLASTDVHHVEHKRIGCSGIRSRDRGSDPGRGSSLQQYPGLRRWTFYRISWRRRCPGCDDPNCNDNYTVMSDDEFDDGSLDGPGGPAGQPPQVVSEPPLDPKLKATVLERIFRGGRFHVVTFSDGKICRGSLSPAAIAEVMAGTQGDHFRNLYHAARKPVIEE